jgi:BMFP domain-containing protein YqiC
VRNQSQRSRSKKSLVRWVETGKLRACEVPCVQMRRVDALWPAVFKPIYLLNGSLEASMQTRNKVLDDISQLMTNAMGVAQGAKTEAETAMKSLMDRWLADRDFVTREEFDAVRAMAQKAREENEALKTRMDALEASSK